MRYRSPYSLVKEKRKGGFVYYYRFYDERGVRNKRSTGQSIKAKAHEYVINLINTEGLVSAGKENEAIARERERAVGFDKFTENLYVWGKCDHIIEKNSIGENTISMEHARITRGTIVNHLQSYFKKKPIQDITQKDIKNFILYLKKEGKISDSTINHILKTLKTVLIIAINDGIITKNPIDGVSRIKAEKKRRGILTIEEVHKLFDEKTIDEIWKCRTSYVFNLFGVLTGCRRGELFGLQNKYVHPSYVEICHSWGRLSGLKPVKTKENRLVPIPPGLYKWLTFIMEGDPDSFVFSFDGGETTFPEKLVTKSLYSALDKIGLKKDERENRNITFHSFRHFFNTYCRARNVTDDKVRAVTGHKTQAMVDNYTHFNINDYKEVLDIQNDILN